MQQSFCTIEQAIEAVAAGRVIIVVDSEDRENEGDFLASAQHIDAETIHFMASVGRGQLCVPVSSDIVDRLQLTPMVPEASDLGLPRFMIPVDHRQCGTGISPAERAATIRAMLDPHSRPADFVRPGHIFPLAARPGGLLERMGHTEASVDLARLAGLAPAGVLCEICSQDRRNMALRDELFEIAGAYRLPMITIDAIVEYRRGESREETALLDAVSNLQGELAVRRLAEVPATTC